MDADRISRTFVFVWDFVLIGENELRSTLNPITFFVCDQLVSARQKSGRFDLRPPLQRHVKTSSFWCLLMVQWNPIVSTHDMYGADSRSLKSFLWQSYVYIHFRIFHIHPFFYSFFSYFYDSSFHCIIHPYFSCFLYHMHHSWRCGSRENSLCQ